MLQRAQEARAGAQRSFETSRLIAFAHHMELTPLGTLWRPCKHLQATPVEVPRLRIATIGPPALGQGVLWTPPAAAVPFCAHCMAEELLRFAQGPVHAGSRRAWAWAPQGLARESPTCHPRGLGPFATSTPAAEPHSKMAATTSAADWNRHFLAASLPPLRLPALVQDGCGRSVSRGGALSAGAAPLW